jgi:hypothetical protein
MGRSSRNLKQLSVVYLVLMLGLGACQISSKKGESAESQTENAPLVDEKYSLTADRKELDELRKDVPAERKKQNDELALLNQFFENPKKSPSDVRAKFDTILRKKRELFQKDMTKIREDYVKDEKKRRDDFNRDLDRERVDFQGKKTDRETRTRFYDDLDGKRRDFYSAERAKRDEFEESMRDKRKNFDDYAREKTDEFQQELKAYTKRFQEQENKN